VGCSTGTGGDGTMSNQPAVRDAVVLRTAWLTPGMVRVVFGGDGLSGFEPGACTDSYVKLLLQAPGTGQPVRRTYTVRRWDPAQGELTIDFVHHGDSGLAGSWAAAAKPGDRISLAGPGGQYAPDPAAEGHLLVGDASALPAIAAALERVGEGQPVHVFLEVDGEAEVQPLQTPGALTATWLERSNNTTGDELLADAVRGASLPRGRVQAFVHGEAGSVRAVRRHLLVERGLPRADMSVSGYWKRGRTDEGWRSDKADWQRQATADEQPLTAVPR